MPVTLQDHDGTVVLTLARPPLNALDLPTINAVTDAIARIAANPPRAGAVFTGSGRAFTAGVDTRFVASATPAARAEMVLAINRTAAVLYRLPFPIVAAINGHAIGAGVVIGLACDQRIAARGEARFGLAEVTAGIPYPAVPMEIVREHLAEPHRSRLVLRGEPVGVDQAISMGIVDECIAPDLLLARAIAVARGLASASAYAAVKQQLRAPVSARIDAIIASGSDPLLAVIAGD